MDKGIDVICMGAAHTDLPLQPVSKNVFDIESYPVDRIALTTGGDAQNEAIIISRLGHKVALMSMVGDDIPGHFVLESCKKNRIDFQSIHVEKSIETSINVGLVTPGGERTFITNRNGSLWRMTIEHMDLNRLRSAKLLSYGSIFNAPRIDEPALVRIFKEARKHNLIICADMITPRLGETLQDIKEALSYLDYFFPNYDEACIMTGKKDLKEIADIFLGCGVKNVIIKNGRKGCYIKNHDGVMEIPTRQIQAIDTIGAGDNFVAGFITAILENKNLCECAVFANMTALVSVQTVGATTGVQRREQVEREVQKYYNDFGKESM
jgi:sugar/nucleoside kinase (ribokinase family)